MAVRGGKLLWAEALRLAELSQKESKNYGFLNELD